MADKIQPGPQFKLNSVDRYILGDAGPHGGQITIAIESNLFQGSMVLQGKVLGSTAWWPIPYTKLYLNAAVGDGTKVSTAITDDSLIMIECAGGVQLALNVTAATAGHCIVTVVPTAQSS